MNIAKIKYNDIANGLGIRTSLFVSGCTHRCKGCFNEEAWDFAYGEPFTRKIEDAVIESMQPSHIRGLSLLGGEPMEPVNQRALLPFLTRFRREAPGKDIWCYTGYTLERDLRPALCDGDKAQTSSEGDVSFGRARCEATDALLSLIDVLVDGEFILAKKSLMLKFRGSENQRLIDLKATLSTGAVVLFDID